MAWAKQRALEYVDAGDVPNALASLNSDLGKHPETKGHSAIELGMMLTVAGHLSSAAQMRDWIDGIN